MNSNERLGTFAEMMNKLGSADHPDLDAFLAQYPEDTKLQELAPTARFLWRRLSLKSSERLDPSNYQGSVLPGLIVTVMLLVFSFGLWWFIK